ncbi:unnamed protein product [Amoebophrya sp. A25]|nr:unnamed protein product [Amoebophrya sp. A25]|eukprot:GSA25T00016811001.1
MYLMPKSMLSHNRCWSILLVGRVVAAFASVVPQQKTIDAVDRNNVAGQEQRTGAQQVGEEAELPVQPQQKHPKAWRTQLVFPTEGHVLCEEARDETHGTWTRREQAEKREEEGHDLVTGIRLVSKGRGSRSSLGSSSDEGDDEGAEVGRQASEEAAAGEENTLTPERSISGQGHTSTAARDQSRTSVEELKQHLFRRLRERLLYFQSSKPPAGRKNVLDPFL